MSNVTCIEHVFIELIEAVMSLIVVKMWCPCATCVKLVFILSQMLTYARFSDVLLVINDLFGCGVGVFSVSNFPCFLWSIP